MIVRYVIVRCVLYEVLAMHRSSQTLQRFGFVLLCALCVLQFSSAQTVNAQCSDAAFVDCGEPSAHQIPRQIELQLVP